MRQCKSETWFGRLWCRLFRPQLRRIAWQGTKGIHIAMYCDQCGKCLSREIERWPEEEVGMQPESKE